MAPADIVRDLGALAALIWALVVPWNMQHAGGEVIYVLLATLCAMASVVVPYVQRASATSAGRPPASVANIRILLVAPLLIVMLVALIRDGVAHETFDGSVVAEQGVFLAGFGAALAIVPRSGDLLARPDAALIARRWRQVAGWLAGLGFAGMVITVVIAIASLSSIGGGFLTWVLVLFSGIALVVAFYAIPIVRVGADHPAWQPPALWLGFGMMFFLAVTSGTTPLASTGNWLDLAFWAVVVGGGLCALPFVGGRDGSPDTVEFWALVVIHALTLILWVSIVFAVMTIATLVAIDGSAGSGILVWTLIGVVITAVAAGVGMSHLRTDPIRGRAAALTCVAIMIAVALISIIVSAAGSGGAAALLTGLPVLAGTYGVIVVGLLAPRPVRAAHAARLAGSTSAGRAPGAHTAPGVRTTAGALTDPAPLADHAAVALPATQSTPPVPVGVPSDVTIEPSAMAPAITAPASMDPAPAAVHEWSGTDAVPSVELTVPVTSLPRSAAGPAVTTSVRHSTATTAPAVATAPALTTALTATPAVTQTAGDAEDVESTVLRPRRSVGGPSGTADPQLAAANSPDTPLDELMTIAYTRADLRAAVAENLSTYPDLLVWLGQLGDPVVDAALARRQGSGSAVRAHHDLPDAPGGDRTSG